MFAPRPLAGPTTYATVQLPEQDEVRLERHDGDGADGAHRAPTRPSASTRLSTRRPRSAPTDGDGATTSGVAEAAAAATPIAAAVGTCSAGRPIATSMVAEPQEDERQRPPGSPSCRVVDLLRSGVLRMVGTVSSMSLHRGSTPKAAGRRGRRAWSSVITLVFDGVTAGRATAEVTPTPLGAPDVVASDDQDAAVVQERRRVATRGALPIEPIAAELAGRGSNISVEDRTRHLVSITPVAAGDEDASVRQQRRGLLLPAFAHRAGELNVPDRGSYSSALCTDGVLRRSATRGSARGRPRAASRCGASGRSSSSRSC